MNATYNISKKVTDYLENRITLEELEDWLAPHLGLFISLPGNNASELAATIELGLAEMTNGHRTEDEFRDLLKEFVKSRDFTFITLDQYQSDYTSSYANYQHEEAVMVLTQEQHLGWKYVDIALGMAS